MPKLPAAVGKYKILDRLGRGGMSIIYKAEHPTLGTPVVLKKLMLKGDSAHRDRFRREAALMMRLRHENVVGVYDHFKDGSGHYLVMEYVDGRPLSELLAREGALPPDEAAWIVGRMALALAHIHSNGIVHRDVKPSNVLIRRDGVVKLADFGIAFSPGSAEDITAEGTALGTPSFMAPEQLEDARCADERSDMWSLGVCFFELITGRKFVTGPTPAAIRESLPAALKTMPQRLPAKLPWRLKKFLRRTLRLRPKSRLPGGGAAIRLLGAGRLGNRPPSGLQKRLDTLIASMEPAPDPTSPAAARNGGDIPDNPPSEGFQSLLSSFLGSRDNSRDGDDEELHKNGTVERGVSVVRSALVHRPFLAVLSLLFLFAAAGVIVIPGAWDRLFRSGGRGMVSLRLVFPAEAPDYWIAGAEAQVFREESESLREVANPVLRASDDGLSLRSRRLTMPIGAYRIRWSLGDTVSWSSFRLPSFRETRNDEGEPLVLEEILGSPPVFPLEIHWAAVDAMTREDIGSNAVMTWTRVDLPGGDLKSGGNYRISISADGYRSSSFAIAVSPWRREIRVSAALWPKSAVLELSNNTQRSIMPRLNGSGTFLDMSEIPVPRRIGKLAPGETVHLTVPPGLHTLTPGIGLEGLLQFSLDAGETISVLFDFDEEGQLSIKSNR